MIAEAVQFVLTALAILLGVALLASAAWVVHPWLGVLTIAGAMGLGRALL